MADADGKPMHSWRVLILPFMQEEKCRDVYDHYNFAESWDGPKNRLLADKIDPVFYCPSSEADRTQTGYVAVVGPETAWAGPNPTKKSITDGQSKTISVVEANGSGIHWMEPRDVTFEDAARGINVPGIKSGISSPHNGGAFVLMCDGAVHFLNDDIPLNTLSGLLTKSGGEDVTLPD